MSAEAKARKWFISGRVQGVGFRAFVQHKAAALGLKGWARNTDDGQVEVYATGTEDRLEDLAATLHVGPRMADVRAVDQQDAALEAASGFSIR